MKITLLRHTNSIFNLTKIDTCDCLLSDIGIKHAKTLQGHYDMVIISPLIRAQDTLNYSQITFNDKQIWDIVREKKDNLCDFLVNEKIMYESENDIIKRINQFKTQIKQYVSLKILIVTHADFIWYLTSHVYDGERFGTWTKNGEFIDFDINNT